MSGIPEFKLQRIGPRLKEIRARKGLTLQEFYGPLSPYINNFSAIENGNRSIGRNLALSIIQLYHINPIYLETGNGSMFLAPWPYDEPELIPKTKVDQKGVPFYNVNPIEFVKVKFRLENLEPDYRVDFEPFNDCDAWLPVYGDSMAPQYINGDWVAIKEIELSEVILWGETYLLITRPEAGQIVALRLVFPHDNPDSLILKSLNSKYTGDTILSKGLIQRLYLVKGKMTRTQW